jgi:hypothetical protein
MLGPSVVYTALDIEPDEKNPPRHCVRLQEDGKSIIDDCVILHTLLLGESFPDSEMPIKPIPMLPRAETGGRSRSLNEGDLDHDVDHEREREIRPG